MGMDDEWKQVYEDKALRDIPDHERGAWSREGFAELLKITQDLVLQLHGITTIIDVGCGVGAYCRALHDKGYHVEGVDYSERMIARAKERNPGMTFNVGNGYNLAYADQAFDLAISIGALQCLYNHEQFLRELARVARKAIIISTHVRTQEVYNPKAILAAELAEDPWPVREYNESEIIPILESAGFETTIIHEYEGKKITDGCFVVAKRKAFK